jgi:hypothetical protein
MRELRVNQDVLMEGRGRHFAAWAMHSIICFPVSAIEGRLVRIVRPDVPLFELPLV